MNVYSVTQTSGNNSMFYARTATVHGRDNGVILFDGLERQMAEFDARSDILLDEVARNFVMPAYSVVREILNEHKILPEILVEGVPYLKRFFGVDSIVTLRISVDTTGSPMLYAVVMWSGSIREVREALEQFDRSWWLARSWQAAGYLVFTYVLT